jgi:hypothetical protein
MVTLQRGEHTAQMTRFVRSFAIGLNQIDRPLRGFLSRKTTPRDPYRARVIAKLRLVLLMEECVVDVRPDFLESEGTAING